MNSYVFLVFLSKRLKKFWFLLTVSKMTEKKEYCLCIFLASSLFII